MKKVIITPFFLYAIACLVLPACMKDGYDPNWRAECRIQQLKGDLIILKNDSAVFAYNAKGDPVSVTKSTPATGFPNYLFRYDTKRRLTEFIGIYYDGLHYEFRHRYGHDLKGRIIKDTVYTFAALTDPLETVHKEFIYNYTYDDQNRIIGIETLHVPTGTRSASQYFYNQQGNLERITGPSGETVPQYDNKVNMHRTHPIWQFIDRDFSVNNPFQAVAYNSRGLPVALQSPACTYGTNFIGIYYNQVEVSYQCRGAAPGMPGHIDWPDNSCPQ